MPAAANRTTATIRAAAHTGTTSDSAAIAAAITLPSPNTASSPAALNSPAPMPACLADSTNSFCANRISSRTRRDVCEESWVISSLIDASAAGFGSGFMSATSLTPALIGERLERSPIDMPLTDAGETLRQAMLRRGRAQGRGSGPTPLGPPRQSSDVVETTRPRTARQLLGVNTRTPSVTTQPTAISGLRFGPISVVGPTTMSVREASSRRRCAAQEHGRRHRGRRGGDEADRLPRCLVGRPAAENLRGATWTNTSTMCQPRYRPKVMVASRVSQRGQVMSSPWRSSSQMMLINAAPWREHRDAGPQPDSGDDHQPGAEAENTSDASTSARYSRAAPSPNRTIAAAVTTQSTQSSPQMLKAYPDGVIVASLVAPEDRNVSGERVGDPRCGDGSASRRPLPQRHTRTAVAGGSTPSAARAISEPLGESTGCTTRRPGSRSRCGAGTGWSTAGRTTTWSARRRVRIRRRAASRGAVWCARRWRRGRGRR